MVDKKKSNINSKFRFIHYKKKRSIAAFKKRSYRPTNAAIDNELRFYKHGLYSATRDPCGDL